MRRAIAEHMTRARAEIPDAWSLTEIDMTNLVRQRQKVQADWQAREGYELTYLPFFIKAVLAGLRAVPELNASFAGDHIRLHHEYNLGVAVSLDNGLVVPVLRNADQLSVAGIARALRTIIQKARGPVGTISGGTISTGYAKDYYYDPRLADNPPPYFPTTGSYDLISWKKLPG